MATPFLVGTKYDAFLALPSDEKTETTRLAIKFADAMKAPIIFCSACESINVRKIFEVGRPPPPSPRHLLPLDSSNLHGGRVVAPSPSPSLGGPHKVV